MPFARPFVIAATSVTALLGAGGTLAFVHAQTAPVAAVTAARQTGGLRRASSARFHARVEGAAPKIPLAAALTVGGGPNKKYNQVAIESNVRYVDSLLPQSAPRRVLFADGSPTTPDVLYHDAPATAKITDAEAAFETLFENRAKGAEDKWRAPKLKAINGPSTKTSIASEMARLAQTANASAASPVLLYFTGHGSPAKSRDLDNNVYDLWGGDTLSVRDLAGEINKLPAKRPVVLVMVQCYGGAFGNVLFENGDPNAKQIDRPLVGFFATTKERVAAGCTPEVNEADYHDFTSSFFAALSGKTRLGQAVPAQTVDYDKNGTVTMDEAFAYALATEPSVDVPVCTSDVFLRRFVPLKDDSEVAGLPYSQVRALANPAQQAALDGLSKALSATGETRLKEALADVRDRADGISHIRNQSVLENGSASQQTLSEWRRKLRSRFPGLRGRSDSTFGEARQKAIAQLQASANDTQTILAASDKIGDAYEAQYDDNELKGARWLRLMRVAKTVVLESRLRKSGNTALIARLDALRKMEKTNPLL